MTKAQVNIASLLNEISHERQSRISNLKHAIHLLRVSSITCEAIALKIDHTEISKDLYALHNIISTMRNAMEDEVINEIKKLNTSDKGEQKIIH